MTKRGVTAFLQSLDTATRKFFDAETDLLIMLDQQGRIARVNPAFERALDRPEQEVLGREFTDLLHPADLVNFIHAFDCRARGTPFRLLHHRRGVISVILETYTVDSWQGQQRTFLILRPLGDTGHAQ